MNLRLAFLALSSLGLAAGGPVLLMSFDGLAAQQFSARTMPRFWKLSQQGQRGEGLPAFPSTTFTGHATLATGCWPDHHGIVANAFIEPGSGLVPYSARAEYLQREPLWVAATRSGVRTAVFHWPCATGPWEGVKPWRLENFQLDTPDRAALAFSAAALRDGAQLVMTYLSGTDSPGHYHGPASRQARAQLARLDAEIAPWVERMLKRHPDLRVLLLADHGMAKMEHKLDVRPLLGQPSTILAHGGSAFVYLTAPLAPGVEAQLTALGLQVNRRQELAANLHLGANPRVGDLVLQAPIGTWISQARNAQEARKELIGRAGAHGYAPEHPEMHTWLVALGTGRTTAIAPAPLWNIAPTIGHWLGIRWQQEPDGVPIKELTNAAPGSAEGPPPGP